MLTFLSLDKSATNFNQFLVTCKVSQVREIPHKHSLRENGPWVGLNLRELLLSVHRSDAAKLQMFETMNRRRPGLTLRQNQATCVPMVSCLHAFLHYSFTSTLCIIFSCMHKLRIECFSPNIVFVSYFLIELYYKMEQELQGNMVLPCQPNTRKGKNNLKQKLLIQDQKGRAQLLMHLD